MNPIVYGQSDTYPICILIKQSAFRKMGITSHYVNPMVQLGVDSDDIIALPLAYNENNKIPVSLLKQTLDDLLPELNDYGVKLLYCADAAYFKKLTGQTKAEVHLGDILPCTYPGYENFQIALGINYSSLLYNPVNETKLTTSLNVFDPQRQSKDSVNENEHPVIKHAHYPTTTEEIEQALKPYLSAKQLYADIETFSLNHYKAGIATIAFSEDRTGGLAFPVDYVPDTSIDGFYGRQVHNPEVKTLLKMFFVQYTGKLLFHGSTFDIKILLYELFMNHLDDTVGLIEGLNILTRNFDDTRIIAYLALNSTARNSYKLKDLSQSFAGNYALDDAIKDIRRVPLPDLLTYNLIDACATAFVYDTYCSVMIKDKQQPVYDDVLKPSLITIIQMELTGMPLNPKRVKQAAKELKTIRKKHKRKVTNHPLIKQVNKKIKKIKWRKDFTSRQSKAKHPENIQPKIYNKFPDNVFNPNSGTQLATLFYDIMKLPVIAKTKSGNPSTDAKTLQKLMLLATPKQQKLLKAITGYTQANTILTTFIPPMKKAIAHNDTDNRVYMHGSFNVGNTVSARLSSSGPNLQNLPSGSTYGKLIKSCFQPPDDWLMVGADFTALEAMVNALTTQDPNKLIVYENGLDSHSWNTQNYWPEKMPDITAKVLLAQQAQGQFYKRKLDDGTYEYLHESEL